MTANAPSDELLEKIVDAIANQAPTEKTKTKCLYHFGYLSTLANNETVPEECLLCTKLVECTMNMQP